MNAKVLNVCRLCLTKDLRCRYEEIHDTIRKALDALLINMNLDVCQNSLICSECVATVLRCLRFKFECVRKEEELLRYTVDNAATEVCLKDFSGVCAFCMDTAKSNLSSIGTLKRSVVKMLPIFFPEKKFCSLRNSKTCSLCGMELEVYFIFLFKCIKTEKNIKPYLHPNEGMSLIKLNNICDVLKTRKHKCSHCPFVTRWKRCLTTHMETQHNTLHEKTYACSICTYKSNWNHNLQRHIERNHSTCINKYKCSDCTFETKYKESLRGHMETQHRDHKNCKITKFKCSTCRYKATRNDRVKSHRKIRRSAGQATKHKCPNCTFETIWKSNLKKHMAIRHNAGGATKYKCPNCTYETKWKGSFDTHVKMQHGAALQVAGYKCSQCIFETKWEMNMRRHMRVQHSASEVETYKCSSCTYETKWKASVKRHMAACKGVRRK